MYILNTNLIFERISSLNHTLSSVGDLVGTSPAKLSLMINNKQKNLDLETLYKLGKLLKLNLTDMIIDDNPFSQSEDNILIERQELLSMMQLTKKLQEQIEKNIKRKPDLNRIYQKIKNYEPDLFFEDKNGQLHFIETKKQSKEDKYTIWNVLKENDEGIKYNANKNNDDNEDNNTMHEIDDIIYKIIKVIHKDNDED